MKLYTEALVSPAIKNLKNKGYRNINLNTIVDIRCGKTIIKRFVGNTGNIYVEGEI